MYWILEYLQKYWHAECVHMILCETFKAVSKMYYWWQIDV